MMIGDRARSFPTVQIPPWDPFDDPTASPPFHVLTSPSLANFSGNAAHGGDYSSFVDSFAALHRYLPSNEIAGSDHGDDPAIDAYSCDQFRMFEFKVRRCVRGRSHDWTCCPFAHPGEKARRRDPRKFHYSGTSCPEFRKGGCQRGDSCEFAHGVFECWLHPARYRTQPCKDGPACRRRVCFFAHTPEQLRVLPQQSPRSHGPGESEYGSPTRYAFDPYLTRGSFSTSPTSILASPPFSPPSDSPPMSPNSPQLSYASFNSVSELVASMRSLHVSKVQMNLHSSRVSNHLVGSNLGPGFGSPQSGFNPFELWENSCCDEEPAMERVESGRDLRAKLYARLSKENSLE